jgi:hypothetical protein
MNSTLFSLILTEDFICGFVFNLCTDTPNYTQERADDFVTRVLSTKPSSIEDDDFMDNLYIDNIRD